MKQHVSGPTSGSSHELPFHLAGFAVWALALSGGWLAAWAVLSAGSGAAGLALLAVLGVAASIAPRLLRGATVHRPRGRAALDGALLGHRHTATGQVFALTALALSALRLVLTPAEGAAEATADLVSTLSGTVAVLVMTLGAGVLFPGAWFLRGRPVPSLRLLFAPVLVAGVVTAWPLGPAVAGALEPLAAGVEPFAAATALVALLLVGSVIVTRLALLLFPRPWTAVDVDASGTHAVAARFGGAHLFELESGRAVRHFAEGGHAARLSPDGAWVALDGAGGEITVRHAATGSVRGRAASPLSGIGALAFSPDGATVAAAGEDPAVAVWHVDAGEPRVFDLPFGMIRSVEVVPEGHTVVAVSQSGRVARIRLDAPAHTAVTASPPQTSGGAARAHLGPGARTLAWAAGTAPRFERVVVNRLRGVQVEPAWGADLPDDVRAVTFDAAGRWVAAATIGSSVRVYAADTGALEASRDGLGGTIASLAVDAPGMRVVIGGRWLLRVWDLAHDDVAVLAGGPRARARDATPWQTLGARQPGPA